MRDPLPATDPTTTASAGQNTAVTANIRNIRTQDCRGQSEYECRPAPSRSACTEQCRKDGWTPARQLAFLNILARTRSVTRAAAAAGMSRESAYRLRRRPTAALFAAAWDRALEEPVSSQSRGLSPANQRSRIGQTPRLASPPGAAISRGNSPKVTKWTKWKTPRFHSQNGQLAPRPVTFDVSRPGGATADRALAHTRSLRTLGPFATIFWLRRRQALASSRRTRNARNTLCPHPLTP